MQRGPFITLSRKNIHWNSHVPFAWGTDSKNAVHNAVVLEELAFIAFHTEAITPGKESMQSELLDKHYLRKHGEKAYYGQ